MTARQHLSRGGRTRPIRMTTLAAVLGILPIALALGFGTESRVSMKSAVIGGLAAGGALTLFVIPRIYARVTRRKTTAAEASHEAGNAREIFEKWNGFLTGPRSDEAF